MIIIIIIIKVACMPRLLHKLWLKLLGHLRNFALLWPQSVCPWWNVKTTTIKRGRGRRGRVNKNKNKIINKVGEEAEEGGERDKGGAVGEVVRERKEGKSE